MSIIVGIQCSDAILLAADSRITDLTTGNSSDIDKIGVIRFGHDEVIVASAGSVPFTNRIIEIAQDTANGKAITADDVKNIMEDAGRVTKNRLDSDQFEYVRQNGAQMLIAFYYQRKPYLFSLDPFGSGIAQKPEKNYCAAGGASPLAEYLIGEHLDGMPHSDLAAAILIFAIKKVKDNTHLCGGQTRIKRISCESDFRRDGTGIIEADRLISFHQEVFEPLINTTEANLSKMDSKTKTSRNKKLNQALKRAAKQINEKYEKLTRKVYKTVKAYEAVIEES